LSVEALAHGDRDAGASTFLPSTSAGRPRGVRGSRGDLVMAMFSNETAEPAAGTARFGGTGLPGFGRGLIKSLLQQGFFRAHDGCRDAIG